MSENVVVDDSVKLTVKFKDIDSNGNEVPVSIDSISLEIKMSDSTLLSVDQNQIISISTSEFYYIFTPTIADTYTIKFIGTYYVGLTAKQILVEQKLYVSSITEEYQPTIILGSDETITFAAGINPLYIDPESLLPFFPDASLLEIAEVIYNYSLEIKDIYSLEDSEDGTNLSFNVLEYIKAATACELSRTYGFGGDDEMSLSLGDLTITNRSLPRTSITRDNATSWCQVAAALRKEMLARKVSPRAMQPKGLPSDSFSGKVTDPETGKIVYFSERELYGPGRKSTIKDDPMPKRGFRRYD
jgi:hypothetical protein